MQNFAEKAVILFSGGLDSATCLAMAKSRGLECHTLSFDYGQKHHVELSAASRLATMLGATTHTVLKAGLDQLCHSALIKGGTEVPEYRGDGEIPVTYVPARNMIFLAYGFGLAESIGASYIYIGANAIDYSGYPDCRPEFFAVFQEAARLGTRQGMEGNVINIQAPLLHLRKHEIILEGVRLGVDYSLTVSCYRANEKGAACGKCDSCFHRKSGFANAGVSDPTIYYEN